MKQQSNDRQQEDRQQLSSLAWFKLAELVTRGEKEKALNFYRLLSHSFEEKAYALQLEGDLLWALKDGEALEKYEQAAFLYKKEKKLICAVAIYEHLLTLEPENSDFLVAAIKYYVSLDWPSKFNERFMNLINLFEQKIITEDFILNSVERILDLAKESEAEGRLKWVLKELNALAKHVSKDLASDIREHLTPVR